MGNKSLKVFIQLQIFGFVITLFAGCLFQNKPIPEEVSSFLYVELLEKARKYTWERHHKRALELLDEVECMKDDLTEVMLLRGEIYYTLENWDAARKEFNAVLEREPRNSQAVVHLWFMDAGLEDFNEQAKDALKKKALEYLAANPDDPEVVYAVVLGLEGAKAVPEKTKVIEEYAHIVENSSHHEKLAEIYFYDTLRAGKKNLLKRARFFRSEFSQYRLRYDMAGMALSHLKKSGPEAIQSEILEILKEEPKNRVLNHLSAEAILGANGDLDQAAKYIRRALKAARKPDSRDRFKFIDDESWNQLMDRARADYYAVYGRIIFLQGEIRKALKLFKKGLMYDAHGHDLNLWYAEALEKTGNYMEALNHFRSAAEQGNSVDAIDGLKRILSLKDDVDPAIHFARIEGFPRFTDVTNEAGLNENTGRRVAWSDINNDGFPDLVIGGRNILKNNCDGSFKDVTKNSGIAHAYGSGGILADFDKDGSPDLVAFTSRSGPRLYFNRTEPGGPIKMKDVTKTAFPTWEFENVPTEAAAAADVDGDGFVDIYFANFEKEHPKRCMCGSDVFYLNQGNGTFVNATSKIEFSSEEDMCGRGVSFTDFNGDRRPDLFVANYRLDPDFLLVNTTGREDHGVLLVDRADELNVRGRNVLGAYGHSIGGSWGYLAEDGPALFVASLAHPRFLGLSDISALYIPLSDREGFEPHFEDFGFAYRETHSDPSFVDVDLDGDLDLFITSVYRGSPSFLYLNMGDKFADFTWLTGARVGNGWGAAWADYDRDGDMDLLVCAGNAPRLLRNETQEFRRNWLEINVVGKKSPRTGIGAKVIVQRIKDGGSWVREVRAGRGTGNQDQAVAHFGLGKNNGPFKVTVQFPSGTDVVLDEVQCCEIIEVAEP